jgi:signal transduction histidine kinase
VDLAELARSVARKLESQATARAVTLRIEAGPDTPLALADTDRIEQVLVNLLDNACKFSRPGGTVTVRVDRGQECTVRVQVCDQGIGIPAADLAHIGERFYRADKARSRPAPRDSAGAAGGSGLGLAIARTLVQAHGGQLWVESAEGSGTTVTFTLPAA